MTLNFMTKWNDQMGDLAGTETYFVHKIVGVIKEITGDYLPAHYCPPDYNVIDHINNDFKDKLHTIRKDKTNRWKEGNKIHFKIWTGKPYHSTPFQFAPIVKCKGIQKIEIKWSKSKPENLPDHGFEYQGRFARIYINTLTLISKSCIESLAINDGFESTEHFFRWFNKDFKGKIIHWTDFRY